MHLNTLQKLSNSLNETCLILIKVLMAIISNNIKFFITDAITYHNPYYYTRSTLLKLLSWVESTVDAAVVAPIQEALQIL